MVNWCISGKMVAPVKISICKERELETLVLLTVVCFFVFILPDDAELAAGRGRPGASGEC